MGPSCNEGKYLQSPGTLKFTGRTSIRFVVRRPCLGPLQVPKIPGTYHRFYTCISSIPTVPTAQSCPHWSTKGCSRWCIKRPHQGSQKNAVSRDKPYGTSHTSTRNIDENIQRYNREIPWGETAPIPNIHQSNVTEFTPYCDTQPSTGYTIQHPRNHIWPNPEPDEKYFREWTANLWGLPTHFRGCTSSQVYIIWGMLLSSAWEKKQHNDKEKVP